MKAIFISGVMLRLQSSPTINYVKLEEDFLRKNPLEQLIQTSIKKQP
jgi:hypothetical protein